MVWLMAAKMREAPDWIVYDNTKGSLMRSDMVSLLPTIWVTDGVIDTWGWHMQCMELKRPPGAPRRFFFTLNATRYTVLQNETYANEQEDILKFASFLDDDTNCVKDFSWHETELVFFPIWYDDHYYLIVFDLIYPGTYIIDNSSSMDRAPLSAKYSHVPKTLVTKFGKYLRLKGITDKASIVEKTAIKRLKMKWRNSTNKVDCGVYVI